MTRDECRQMTIGLVAFVLGLALMVYQLPRAVVVEHGPSSLEWVAP